MSENKKVKIKVLRGIRINEKIVLPGTEENPTIVSVTESEAEVFCRPVEGYYCGSGEGLSGEKQKVYNAIKI